MNKQRPSGALPSVAAAPTKSKIGHDAAAFGIGMMADDSNEELLGNVAPRARYAFLTPANCFLAIATIAFVLPTMIVVATDSWSTEQGAHGPLVLMTGLWLLHRELTSRPCVVRPGNGWLSASALLLLLGVFIVARIGGIIEIEAGAMYLSLLVVAYGLFGVGPLRLIWFPLIYLVFIFPPPDSLFAIITQPMKIFVSYFATALLQMLGYQIVNSGVMIQIGQYEMLVAAACSGLNSLISLTALGLFYTFVRHSSNLRHMIILVLFIVPIAIVANIVRVLILLLITYHFGEEAGQGFFHETAGLVMFTFALLSIFAVDAMINWSEHAFGRVGKSI